MKKFLGILVAVMLCVCAIAPAASAADLDLSALTGALEGVDLSNLSADEISDTLGMDLGKVDVALAELENAGSADGISSMLSSLAAGSDAASGSDFDLSALTDMLGGVDLSGLTDLVSGDALSGLTDMFEGIDMSSFDISGLADMISGAFGDSGVDLGAVTGGLDMGSFDIGSVLGGLTAGGSDGSATDAISGIADALMGGLSSLGLDTSMLDGLADTDIVNMFGNLFMGLGATDDNSNSNSGSTATTSPAATTATPNTGDSSAVFVAFGTLCVASAAAFVCLKKNKED